MKFKIGLAILLTPILLIGGCIGLSKTDIYLKSKSIQSKFNDNYDDLIIKLQSLNDTSDKRIMVSDNKIPIELKSLNPSYLVIDSRGYVVIYYDGPYVWRGVVIKKSTYDGIGVNLLGNDWNGNTAYYTGHHIP